eukprot:TRINITY_DN15393_c0_g1_i5.p1 TRINITY_DN15393_c0_g1~~TRINITY_DN15393_c0_g1_i5.p1  ORF type:complete len:900 (-),score=218.55 TRINITY_DN15393_c0_g1_i5:72-2771(-)
MNATAKVIAALKKDEKRSMRMTGAYNAKELLEAAQQEEDEDGGELRQAVRAFAGQGTSRLFGRRGEAGQHQPDSFVDANDPATSSRSSGRSRESAREDAEDVEEDGGRRPSTDLRHYVRKVIDERRASQDQRGKTGVTIQVVAKRARTRFKTQYGDLKNDKEKTFISDISRSLPLMLRETTWLRSIRELCSRARVPDQSSFMNAIIDIMHKLKVVTIRIIWCHHVEPLLAKCDMLYDLHDGLKKKFNTVRAQYLTEITSLRDSARERKDYEQYCKGGDPDIAYFYEPETSLSDEEMKFVSHVVSEKLKMILEHNERLAGLVNAGQIAAMERKTENIELVQTKKALQKQIEQNAELQSQITALQEMVPTSNEPRQRSTSGDKQVNAHLENKVEELRERIFELEEERSNRDAEEEDLKQAYEAEVEERRALQQQLQELQGHHEEAKTSLAETEQKLENATRIAAGLQEERNALSEQVERLRAALLAAKQTRRIARQGTKGLAYSLNRGSRYDSQHGASPKGGRSCRSRFSSEETDPTCSPKTAMGLCVQRLSSGFIGAEPEAPVLPERPTLPRARSAENTAASDTEDSDVLGSMIAAEASAQTLLQEKRELKAENCRLRTKIQQAEEEIKRIQDSRTTRLLDDTADRTSQLQSIAEVVGALGISGENDAPCDDPEVKAKKAELHRLQIKAHDLCASISESRQHGNNIDSDMLQELEDVRRSILQAEFNVLVAEVLFVAQKWANSETEGSYDAGVVHATRNVLQKTMGKYNELVQMLEYSQVFGSHLTEQIDELQSGIRRNVSDLLAVPAVNNDPALLAKVETLEKHSNVDIVDASYDSVQRPEVLRNLTEKRISKRTSENLCKHAIDSLKKLLPRIHLDKDNKAPLADAHRDGVFATEPPL